METLTLGDPNQALLFAGAITLLGVLLGAIAYAICSNRGAVRLGWVLAGALVACSAAIAWSIFFLAPFYAIDIAQDEIHVERLYPRRTITLSRTNIERFERRNEVTKNDYTVVLVIHTKDGRVLTSGTLTPRELAERYERLSAWLRGS